MEKIYLVEQTSWFNGVKFTTILNAWENKEKGLEFIKEMKELDAAAEWEVTYKYRIFPVTKY